MKSEDISIIDLIRRSGFEASVITTYNAYLPFYEEVVLQHLLSNGYRHNILLMDQNQFNECMHSEDLRPQCAGYDYTLIPIRSTGVFHPKIVLLAGKYKGHLLVGSHNLTLSGWGTNRELTTRFDISDGKEKQGLAKATAAWRFIKNWIEFQKDLPDSIVEAINALARMAPWLNPSSVEDEDSCHFFGSMSTGPSLWEMVQGRIKRPIQRISVMGPFFDHTFDFLKTLQENLEPNEMIVGIEPATVDLPFNKLSCLPARIVDTSSIIQRSGYIHAKAIYFESEEQGNILITGSANPSRPAWTNDPNRRNTEAIIMHEGQVADAAANAIGIDLFYSLPKVSGAAMEKMRTRLEMEHHDLNSQFTSRAKVCIATLKNKGICFSEDAFPSGHFQKAECMDADQRLLQTVSTCYQEDNKLILPVGEEKIADIRLVLITFTDGDQLTALVHHSDIVIKKTISSWQVQFRKSLASLQSDNPDIENVIATVEKIIFEEPVEISSNVRRKSGGDKQDKGQALESTELYTLGIHYDETKTARRRRRMVKSGELAYLLDILIHHLGKEVQTKEIECVDEKGRSEEEQIGEDDEDTNENDQEKIIQIDTPKLVKICNGKVRRLIKRLNGYFQKTYEEGKEFSVCLMKLLAVLALLRELRSLDFKWPKVPFEASFFPADERRKLLRLSLKYLYGNQYRFLEKAKAECIDEKIDEFSRFHGLLMWLAGICGADFRIDKQFGESPKQAEIRSENKADLLLFLPDAACDDLSIEEAQVSFTYAAKPYKKADYRDWLSYHQKIGQKLFKLRKQAHLLPYRKRKPKAKTGEIGFIWGQPHPTFHLVLKDGKEVLLSDIEFGEKAFTSDKVASVNSTS